ncbi:hypothetical protein ACRJ4W_39825 [Streptomyces sp. GLT-R25]
MGPLGVAPQRESEQLAEPLVADEFDAEPLGDPASGPDLTVGSARRTGRALAAPGPAPAPALVPGRNPVADQTPAPPPSFTAFFMDSLGVGGCR